MMLAGLFKQFLFPLIAGFALMLLVHAQDQKGFISIDCGIEENSGYSEKKTEINYISDATFIHSGERRAVLPENRNNRQQPYWSLRSFPQGVRNCYKINVTSATTYLIRASFFYGNYDEENILPEFELHLGPNLWDSVSLKNASIAIEKELIHNVSANKEYLHVCLVNTGSGVPFISAIELRPLPDTTYQTQTGSLALYTRLDTGQIAPDLIGYRYPSDVYDRFWYSYSRADWTQLSTLSAIVFNDYQPGFAVMHTAAKPNLATDDLSFFWVPGDKNEEYYVYMHFAEVEELPANQSRQLNITRNGKLYYGPFAPGYLKTTTILSRMALSGGQQNFTIKGAGNSGLPPILNAFEIYMVKEFSELETNQDDVNAITNVKTAYKIEKNWQGDPCLPKNYTWEGLKCSYSPNDSPRIIYLDLSSSGLTGEIDASIHYLTMIQTLDLSNNNLTGHIPDFLSQTSSLNVLNLDNNKLTGSVPNELAERVKNDLVSLSLCNNPHLSGNVPCKKKKKKQSLVIPIIGSIVGILVLLLIVVIIFWRLKRKRQHAIVLGEAQPPNGTSVELEPTRRRRFTYSDILKITNNKQRILGEGGFGTVYHGCLNDNTEVAVKLLSSSSSQGLAQFHAEVNLLLRVHHTNLTMLVGYCDDENNKGLVYEYMAKGNLQEYLSDKSSDVLAWDGRLQIATDAAQGLEYLHYGCKPPMIHRDVKTTNILLSANFQAKLSDFGLSRNIPAGDGTDIVTCVAGTPGYLAPEYKQLNRFNEKSDVYSFGIALLEIVTGRPAVSRTRERIAISEWVGSIIPKGDIDSIVDPRLKGVFNVSSAWKVVEIAMDCVSQEPNKRPTMSKVAGELKQCLETQLAQRNQSGYEFVSQNGYSITMLRPSVR